MTSRRVIDATMDAESSTISIRAGLTEDGTTELMLSAVSRALKRRPLGCMYEIACAYAEPGRDLLLLMPLHGPNAEQLFAESDWPALARDVRAFWEWATREQLSAPDICNILRKLMTTFHIFVPGWLLLYPVTVPGRRCAMAPSPSQVECTEATGTKDRQYARCYRTRVAATDGSFAKVECTEAPKYTKTKI